MPPADDDPVELFVGPSGAILSATASTNDLFGSELVGLPFEVLFRHDDKEAVARAVRSARAGASATIEVAAIVTSAMTRPSCVSAHPDGDNVRLRIQPLETPYPSCEGSQTSSDRYEVILRDLPLGVLILGPSIQMLYWNRRALELLGVTEDELSGKTAIDPEWQILREGGAPFPFTELPVQRAIETGLPQRGVTIGVYRPATDDRVWLYVDAIPIVQDDGLVAEVICTFTDISQHRSLRGLRNSAEALEMAGQIATRVARRFNNLLGVVATLADNLGAALPPRSQRQKSAQAIACTALEGATLSRQLLSVIGLERSRPIAFDASERLAALTSRLKTAASPGRLTITKSDGIRICLEPRDLDFALLELVTNAASAIGPSGHITVSLTSREQGAVFEVQDNGNGLSAEALERAFEPFFSAGARESTGLGLSTVRAIAEASNGGVRLSSTEGGGTTAILWFPQLDEPTELTDDAPRPMVGATILVVDDNALLRRAVASRLRMEGYHVLLAADAAEAQTVLASNDVRVMVCDLVMPGQDGISLRDWTRIHYPTVRVLLYSGHTEDALRGRGLDPGADYLPKPFEPAELLRRVADLASRPLEATCRGR